jgi:predicted RNA binding protein YcfA (HicA-like mRNA interferase family)
VKYRDIIRRIEEDGWRELPRKSGSHRKFAHPSKPGIVTIAPHGLNADVPTGTLNSILKQAGLK